MLFLLTLTFLMWAHLITSLKSVPLGGRAAAIGAGHFGAASLLAGGFLLGFLGPGNGVPVSLDAPNYSVWFFLAGGAAGVALSGFRLWQAARRQMPAQGLAFGVAVWVVLGGLYMVGTTIDHFWYFRGDQVGVGSAEGLGAPDVQCDRVLLVRMAGDTAEYRCPKFAVYGPPFGHPFVPWPDYRAGQSVALKKAIDDLTATAQRGDGAPAAAPHE